jgi:hypothetical protein
VYAAVAVALRWWPSAVVALAVAVMLWRRLPRARFAAYVFFSVLAARGALTGVWGLTVFGLAAIALLQTPVATRAWPRVRPGRLRGGGPPPDDRMRR